jgi:hypothetical protein
MTIDARLGELAELPVSLPDGMAERAWYEGRRQRRRQVRLAVSAVVLAVGVTTSVVVAAHPALAAPETTTAAVATHYPRDGSDLSLVHQTNTNPITATVRQRLTA